MGEGFTKFKGEGRLFAAAPREKGNERMPKQVIQVNERPPLQQAIPLSIQHMFAMFGASVLVPTLLHIDPGIVLLMNGLGTLFFIWITKCKAPAYLGSSFAFIAPALLVMAAHGSRYATDAYLTNPTAEQTAQHMEAFAYAQGGFVVVGLAGCLLAVIIYKFGSRWIDIVLPPAAMGPVVALIGLELAGSAASTGGLLPGDGESVDPRMLAAFLVTLCIAVFGSVLFRKFFAVIPILIAIVAGYVTAACLGLVDFTQVQNAPVLAMPQFQMAKFDLTSILTMLPVILVIASEHIGHQIVTSKIVGRDLIKDPGLHRSLLGDNISTAVSGLVGSVPTTTYGENIGVMAMTKVYSVWVIGGAAVLSLVCGFIGKFSALISTIPGAVVGGISFLLYGMIGSSGLRILVDSKVDYGRARNQAMTAVVFVTGLSGVSVNIGQIQLKGMVLACIVGMLMGILFYIFDRLHWTNDVEAEPAGKKAK